MTRAFIIAGELSGDRLGAALMARLKKKNVKFEGIGGPSMISEGLTSRFDMSELSLMGLMEILPRIPRMLRRIRQTSQAILSDPPDVIITIDSPDFCLRVLKRVRASRPDIKTVHYVAPSVWAWRPERGPKMAKTVDHVLALLPFEPPYMEAAGMSCDFVGHPVADEKPASKAQQIALRKKLSISYDAQVLLCLPGSRKGELKQLGPIYREVLKNLIEKRADMHVVIPMAHGLDSLVAQHFGDLSKRVHILKPEEDDQKHVAQKRAAFATSDLALATSGTVALELAAQQCPMVIGYRANRATEKMIKKLIQIETGNLVNLITDTRIVPEFLFENCTADLLTHEVDQYLTNSNLRTAQIAQLNRAMESLGRGQKNRQDWAARSVLEHLKR